MKITFTVPGKPRGKERPRFANGHAYTPDKTKDYEEKVGWCWKLQSGESFGENIPIKMKVAAYFPIPQSASQKKRAALDGTFHTSKCDLDNLIKCLADSLNGRAYPDDAAISVIHAEKRYSDRPRVEVCLETLGE